MVNMSRILLPCSQPTSMMTPETHQRQTECGVQTPWRRRAGRSSGQLTAHTPYPRRLLVITRLLTDDAEGIKRQLLPQQVHALLQRSFRSLTKQTGNRCFHEHCTSGWNSVTFVLNYIQISCGRPHLLCLHHLEHLPELRVLSGSDDDALKNIRTPFSR